VPAPGLVRTGLIGLIRVGLLRRVHVAASVVKDLSDRYR
jgi:hypothetical protein